MVRYFWGWTPLVIVGTIIFLTLPWLGVIALMLVALFAVAALSWAVLAAPFLVGRAIHHRWHSRSGATPRTAVAPPVYAHQYAYAARHSVDSMSVVGARRMTR